MKTQVLNSSPEEDTAFCSQSPLGELIPLRQMAEELHVTPRTLRRYVKKGQIPHLRIGNQILFQRAAVLTALSQP